MHSRQFARVAFAFLTGAVAVPVVAAFFVAPLFQDIVFLKGVRPMPYRDGALLLASALLLLSVVSLALYAACLQLGAASPGFRTSAASGLLSTVVAGGIFALTQSELPLVLVHVGVAMGMGLFTKAQTAK